MQNILVLYAHPNPQDSQVNKALLNAVSNLDHVTVHDLYQHYPAFDIDIKAEQALLLKADVVIFQHPLYWYSCPAIMKEWIDVVLQNGFAYGHSGSQLQGKKWMQAITTGGDDQSYSKEGKHFFAIEEFLKPFERTAAFCGMDFLPALINHDAIHFEQEQLEQCAQRYARALKQLSEGENTHA